MDILHAIYPCISRWAFELFILVAVRNNTMTLLMTLLGMTTVFYRFSHGHVFVSPGGRHGSRVARSYVTSNSWKCCQGSSKLAVAFCIASDTVQVFLGDLDTPLELKTSGWMKSHRLHF